MPTKERLSTFITAVVTGDHVDAIREFYDENATMQENLTGPRCTDGA